MQLITYWELFDMNPMLDTEMRLILFVNERNPSFGNEFADNQLALTISKLMELRLTDARSKGRHGWWNQDVCSHYDLVQMLNRSLIENDYVSTINFSSMVAVREAYERQDSSVDWLTIVPRCGEQFADDQLRKWVEVSIARKLTYSRLLGKHGWWDNNLCPLTRLMELKDKAHSKNNYLSLIIYTGMILLRQAGVQGSSKPTTESIL
ncbi:hypothetical protein [Vibrio parahaemolyticus]|uniref:hypothetical protein n=3 Tax=Vibrio harveyi group TaxID=717610 RepID=UPI0012B8B176|nr:hypothetical protein [Vibrio parahaemolyticus]